MQIECENCGASSPLGSTECVGCSESFEFLKKEDASWEPNDYSMWLYSQHFQICQKRDQQGLDALSDTERLNYLVGYLYYQVHNGGVWQYLTNPCATEASLLSEALRSIDAPRLADALDECLSHFPPEGPPQDQDERDEIVDNIPDSIASDLAAKVSRLVCDEDSVENLLVLLRRAIRVTEKSGAVSRHT